MSGRAEGERTVALTGATGFVGGAVLDRLLGGGWQVRALTRRAQPARDAVSWIAGDLADAAALERLCEGGVPVIHVAGVTTAPDAAGFVAGNVAGTVSVLAAAQGAQARRFVHVSSLAAREPGLSHYGGSKRGGEDLVTASALDWRVVRPPAVYGPGDRDNLELFRLARRGVVPLPPRGRLSVIHVDDLARLLVAALEEAPRAVWEPDDGLPGGWSHAGYARAVGAAVGRRVLPLPLPAPVLRLAARADRRARGADARLTPDRVAYFLHPDWVADPARRPPFPLWRPAIATAPGLAATAAWYRAQGWL